MENDKVSTAKVMIMSPDELMSQFERELDEKAIPLAEALFETAKIAIAKGGVQFWKNKRIFWKDDFSEDIARPEGNTPQMLREVSERAEHLLVAKLAEFGWEIMKEPENTGNINIFLVKAK